MKRAQTVKPPRPRLRWLALASVFCLTTLAPGSLSAQEARASYHVTRYDLDVELTPEVHQLRARARLDLVADEPLASLALHLNKNLRVERVLGDAGQSLTFEQLPQAPTFRVDLPQALAAGQTLALTVHYVGAFDPALRPPSGPVLAVIAPGNSYLLPPARWFPQASNGWNRFAFTLRVTVPEGEIPIAAGAAEPPQPAEAGKTRTVFRVSEPALAGTLVVGNYQKIEPPASAPLSFYLLTAPESYATRNAETLGEILAFFSDKFGPLENPALAIVETPDDTWEFYSAPGVLLLPSRQWSARPNPRLLARAAAWQWWAGSVSPANGNDLWLAAGLARYSEALYLEHSAGTDGLRQVLEDLTIAALVDESAATIAHAARLARFSPEFNSVVRDKGAMVFHMLRRVMGDDPFFRLLRAYRERFAGREVTVDDFERLANEVAGEPLDYFFAEWIRSTGVPEFELNYVIYRTREGFRVGGEINHALEIFRMPVEVRVETEGPPVIETVEVTGPSTDFSIETFGKPTRVEIDPDFNVLKFTPDLKLRVAIARGEANFGRGNFFEAIQNYQQALEVKRNSSLAHYRMGETFFQQRNYQAAANAFREALNGDHKPDWTVVWSYISLGMIYDISGHRERAVNEYRRALETNDDTAGAQETARKYLREPYRRPTRTIEQIERR